MKSIISVGGTTSESKPVEAPAGGATDNCVARYDGASGQLLQNSTMVLNDDGSVAISGGETTHTINGASVNSVLEVHSDGGSNPAGLTIHNHGDSAVAGTELTMLRSKGTHDVPTLVTDGTQLGRISGFGFDGTDYAFAGTISFEVDGVSGNNDMPGRIVFSTTADGADTVTERMRIDSTGEMDVTGTIKWEKEVFSYTSTPQVLALTHRSSIVEMDLSSANQVTVPTDASVNFLVGAHMRVVQIGTGVTTVQADTGVTLNGTVGGSKLVPQQCGCVRLYKRAANDWIAV